MRVITLTKSPNFARVIKAYCDRVGINVTEHRHLPGNAASLARFTDALIVHTAHVDGSAIDLVTESTRVGFQNVFLVSSEPIAGEWQERAYLAGAFAVSEEPVREQLLIAQLNRVGRRIPEPPPAQEAAPTTSIASVPASEAGATDLTTTRTIARLLRHAHDADRFIDAFLQHVVEQIAVNRVALYLLGPEHYARDLHCAVALGVDAQTFHHAALSLESGIGAYLRRNGTILTVGSHVARDAQAVDEMRALGVHVAVPVADRSALMGVLLLGRHITGEELRRDEMELVFHLASALGLVVRNARLNSSLKEERAFFASVLDQMGVGSLVIDKDLRVLHANRRVAEAFEHSSDEPLRFEHLPQPVATAVYEVMKGPEGPSRRLSLHTSLRRSYELVIDHFQLSAGAAPGVLVLSQDQTESEERLSSAVAAERADVMGRVAHQFGHIVRNSLTHLSTVAQLLPQRSADQEFLEEVCARTPTELHRVLHSVDQLDWMKRTIGPAVPINHIADRAEAIWQRLQTALGFATWPNLQVIVPHVTIWCEEASLEVVLYELLANAAHARPREGGVILTADEPGPNTVTFHIHDDGPGFTADALVRGIEPFYTTGNHGVGLGLTIVDRVVRAHGGKLRFSSSRRARGADVAFTLPLQPS